MGVFDLDKKYPREAGLSLGSPRHTQDRERGVGAARREFHKREEWISTEGKDNVRDDYGMCRREVVSVWKALKECLGPGGSSIQRGYDRVLGH